KERRQFARPVGSFQGLKHRLADLWVSITQARAASRYAAACLASGAADTEVAVAMAKANCSEVAVNAAQECVQMHGGIGFTWEHAAHLYLKRAKADSIGFGTPDAHRAALAVAAIVLFLCYLRLSRAVPNGSDGADQALQAWDMLHGNWLLRGWTVGDVSYYTTELPEYVVVELIRGLGQDTVHVAAAV